MQVVLGSFQRKRLILIYFRFERQPLVPTKKKIRKSKFIYDVIYLP